jgi:hypothetical protein
MTNRASFPADGGRSCRTLRCRLQTEPMFVHCCHCAWCQRETGSAFVLTAAIGTERVQVLAGNAILVHTASASGLGQQIARCPSCQVAVWSHYGGAGAKAALVRVGTLDESRPLPPGVPAFAQYYERAAKLWPAAMLARRAALLAAPNT